MAPSLLISLKFWILEKLTIYVRNQRSSCYSFILMYILYNAFGLNALCSASIAILLGHLRVSYDDVKKAVLSCDTQLLSIERLQQMEKYAPNKKEVIKRIVTVIFYI